MVHQAVPSCFIANSWTEARFRVPGVGFQLLFLCEDVERRLVIPQSADEEASRCTTTPFAHRCHTFVAPRQREKLAGSGPRGGLRAMLRFTANRPGSSSTVFADSSHDCACPKLSSECPRLTPSATDVLYRMPSSSRQYCCT